MKNSSEWKALIKRCFGQTTVYRNEIIEKSVGWSPIECNHFGKNEIFNQSSLAQMILMKWKTFEMYFYSFNR